MVLMYLVWDRIEWMTVVLMVMNFRTAEKASNFFIG